MEETERTYITPEDVEAWVDEVAAKAGDPEAAHGEEDELWGRVLRAVADHNCEDPSLCAFIALQTKDIQFARWRA